MRKSVSVLLFSLAKAAITITLIAIIVAKIDFSALTRHLGSAGTSYLVLGAFLLVANVPLVAVRWWLLLRRLDAGPIGADALRGWLCYQRGIAMRLAVMSLITDRLLALLGLVAVAGAAWCWQFNAVDPTLGREIVILGAVVVAATAAALWLAPALTDFLARRSPRFHRLQQLPAIFRFTALSGAGAAGLALGAIVITLTINAVILFARGLGVTLAPSAAYLIVPVAILSSSLPISIGGWGVREASLSYGLTLLGVPTEDAALLGLALGIGLLVASLPGGIVMLLLGTKARSALPDAEPGLADGAPANRS
jgi:glycosyltransferase 2 family protein